MKGHSLAVVWCAGVLPLLLAILPGCSVFQSSRAIDMTPFAENTALIFADAAKVNRPPKWNYLKPYASLPEVLGVRRKSEPLLRGLRGIVMYSNQLVALNLSSKPDREKNRLLATYFKEAAAKVAERKTFDSIGFSADALDTVYKDIERAETFRAGIEAASPLVNAVVVALMNRLDELDAEIPVIIGAIDQRIESEYADKRRNYAALVRMQTELLHVVTLLYASQKGDREALGQLLEINPSLRELFPSPEKAGPREFRAAEEALAVRLERVSVHLHQMESEKAEYTGKQQELENLRLNTDERLKVARDAVMVWAQSHRNLGAGIAVPPLIDVAGLAGGFAKKVVPLP